ncbi:MAG: DUF3568 family protein [Candidatus Omnitrophota bacterium]
MSLRKDVNLMRLKNLLQGFAVLLVLVQLAGCFWLVIGAAGAVGGYAVTRDTIQGEYDVGYSDVWKSSVEVCGLFGIVNTKDSSIGTIQATVDGARVKIEVTQLTPEATRIKVKARKGIFPRLGTAEKVFVKIVQQLM